MADDWLILLQHVVQACEQTGIQYALIGAVARNAWAPPRATTDVDVAIVTDMASYPNLIDALDRRGIRVRRTVVNDANDTVPDVDFSTVERWARIWGVEERLAEVRRLIESAED